MAFKSIWHEAAVEDLFELDRSVSRKIIGKVKGHLTKSPQKLGQPLRGQFRGLFRYRVGDYRLIYAIDHEQNAIMILAVGHRKDIYRG